MPVTIYEKYISSIMLCKPNTYNVTLIKIEKNHDI